MDNKRWLQQFLKDRSEALLSMDKGKILAYCKKYDTKVGENETVFWVGVHKARTALKDLPAAERLASKKWLEQRGFRSLE